MYITKSDLSIPKTRYLRINLNKKRIGIQIKKLKNRYKRKKTTKGYGQLSLNLIKNGILCSNLNPMKKNYIFLLLNVFLLLNFQSAFSQKKKSIKKLNLKSVTESVISVEEGKSKTLKDSYTGFDKNGNVLSEIKYNADGSIRKKTMNKYDEEGNKTEEAEYNGSGKLISKIVNTYNAKGDKSTEMEYDVNNVLLKKSLFSYDSRELKTEKKIYNGSNVLIKTHKYSYEINKDE